MVKLLPKKTISCKLFATYRSMTSKATMLIKIEYYSCKTRKKKKNFECHQLFMQQNR